MKKNAYQISLYIQPEYRDKAARLIDRLNGQGVRLVDQKGNPSLSALFRYLIDQELNRKPRN